MRRGRHAPLRRAWGWSPICGWSGWRQTDAVNASICLTQSLYQVQTSDDQHEDRDTDDNARQYGAYPSLSKKIHKKENLLINPPSPREEASFSTCERRLNLIKRLVILIIPDWNPRQRGRNHPPDWFLDHSFSSERLTIIHWYSIEYLTLTIPSIDIYVEQFVSHKLTINK